MPGTYTVCRTDANHAPITQELMKYRKHGVVYRNTHTTSIGDIIAALEGVPGSLRIIEIKDPAKSPSKRKLTPTEQDMQDDFGPNFVVCLTWQEVLDAIGYQGPRDA